MSDKAAPASETPETDALSNLLNYVDWRMWQREYAKLERRLRAAEQEIDSLTSFLGAARDDCLAAEQRAERARQEALEDTKRLDYLEREAEIEAYRLRTLTRGDYPLALFRRNVPITRDTIDEALRAALPLEPAAVPEGVAPSPRYVEHIQFEGRDCVVLSPEEYEALWNIAAAPKPKGGERS